MDTLRVKERRAGSRAEVYPPEALVGQPSRLFFHVVDRVADVVQSRAPLGQELRRATRRVLRHDDLDHRVAFTHLQEVVHRPFGLEV